MVQAISKRVEDGHAQFTLHETYSTKHSIEKQHNGRWKLNDCAEVLGAIELAKSKKVMMVME